MIKTLKALFEQSIARHSEAPDDQHTLHLAAAALLMEISRADDDIAASERAAIEQALASAFELDSAEIDGLINASHAAVEDAVSLYEFTEVVNAQFSREQKIDLMTMLWRVAYADADLDHYEEYYVRKISDLLHISHSDYIRTKHRVMPDA